MNKKTSIIAGTLLVILALGFGFVLLNKGDGPIMGIALADRAIMSESFMQQKTEPDEGIYLIVEKEYNKLKEKYRKAVPSGEELYATIYVVECPKGTAFTAKWTVDGGLAKEETKMLKTDRNGVMVFMLEEGTPKGNGVLEVSVEGKLQLKVLLKIE